MMRDQVPVLKVKVKKCPLCGDRHLGATKVCDKCKSKK